MPRRSAGVALDPVGRRGQGRTRSFRRCHRPADDQLQRLRVDRRQQRRPAVRPVLLFGMGGQLVELFRDRALALPPLTTTLARRMIEHTKIYGAFKGFAAASHRPGPARAAAGQVRTARRRAAVDQGDRHQPAAGIARAADRARRAGRAARSGTPESALPRLAIRPYPSQLRRLVEVLRRRRHGDPAHPGRRTKPLMSRSTLYSRRTRSGAGTLRPRSARAHRHDRLVRVCFNDYDREMPSWLSALSGTGRRRSSASRGSARGTRRTAASSPSWSRTAASA